MNQPTKGPTDKQIQWFWEQIFGKEGVEFGKTAIDRKLVCYRRTKWIEVDEEYDIEVIPNTESLEFFGYLFEYAVPVWIDKIMAEQGCSSDLAYAIMFKKWLEELELDIPHAAETLFRAIYKALGGE